MIIRLEVQLYMSYVWGKGQDKVIPNGLLVSYRTLFDYNNNRGGCTCGIAHGTSQMAEQLR